MRPLRHIYYCSIFFELLMPPGQAFAAGRFKPGDIYLDVGACPIFFTFQTQASLGIAFNEWFSLEAYTHSWHGYSESEHGIYRSAAINVLRAKLFLLGPLYITTGYGSRTSTVSYETETSDSSSRVEDRFNTHGYTGSLGLSWVMRRIHWGIEMIGAFSPLGNVETTKANQHGETETYRELGEKEDSYTGLLVYFGFHL
ncbi:MAG: hypothetical protein AB7T49_14635 [Oligoflexales bacterium]